MNRAQCGYSCCGRKGRLDGHMQFAAEPVFRRVAIEWPERGPSRRSLRTLVHRCITSEAPEGKAESGHVRVRNVLRSILVKQTNGLMMHYRNVTDTESVFLISAAGAALPK